MASLSAALFRHDRIQTTLGYAKALRPFAEKIITLAKKAAATDDTAKKLHFRRLALAKVRDESSRALPLRRQGSEIPQTQRWIHPHLQARTARRRRRKYGDYRAHRSRRRRLQEAKAPAKKAARKRQLKKPPLRRRKAEKPEAAAEAPAETQPAETANEAAEKKE